MRVADDTYLDLLTLVNCAFYPEKASDDFHLALINWFHYEARRIPRRKRMVTVSQQVSAQQASFPAIKKLIQEFEQSGDLTPWLNDPIRKRKSDPKADLMFNDWKISHFHLGEMFERPDKVKRTDDLLFAYVKPDEAIFLDIKPHGSWAMTDLLRILVKVGPNDMEQFRLKGVLAPTRQYSDDDLLRLRQAGLSTIITIDQNCYASPGMGISTSRHGTRFVMFEQRLRREIARLLDANRTDTLDLRIMRRLARNLMLPVRLGVRMYAGELILYDKNRQLDFLRMPCLA